PPCQPGLSHLREGPLIGGQDFRPRRYVFRAQWTYNVISKTLFTTLCFWGGGTSPRRGGEGARGGPADAATPAGRPVPSAPRRMRRRSGGGSTGPEPPPDRVCSARVIKGAASCGSPYSP